MILVYVLITLRIRTRHSSAKESSLHQQRLKTLTTSTNFDLHPFSSVLVLNFTNISGK